MKRYKTYIVLSLMMIPFFVKSQDQRESQKSNHNFALDLGYGYRLSSKPNELFTTQTTYPNHYSALRSGIEIDFNYDYLYRKNIGIGFKASAFNSSNTLAGQDTLGLKDDEYIFYFGPTIKYSINELFENASIYARATIGYMSFRNSSVIKGINSSNKVVGLNAIFRGHTIGFGLDLGLDYEINDYLSLGCNTGLLGGNLNKLKILDSEKRLEQSESLYRLNLTIGVRIKL